MKIDELNKDLKRPTLDLEGKQMIWSVLGPTQVNICLKAKYNCAASIRQCLAFFNQVNKKCARKYIFKL